MRDGDGAATAAVHSNISELSVHWSFVPFGSEFCKKIKVVGATKLKYNFEKERCLIKNLSHLKIKDPSVSIDSMSSKA